MTRETEASEFAAERLVCPQSGCSCRVQRMTATSPKRKLVDTASFTAKGRKLTFLVFNSNVCDADSFAFMIIESTFDRNGNKEAIAQWDPRIAI